MNRFYLGSCLKNSNGDSFYYFNDGQAIYTHDESTLLKYESENTCSISTQCNLAHLISDLCDSHGVVPPIFNFRMHLGDPNNRTSLLQSVRICSSVTLWLEGILVTPNSSIIYIHIL